jgi:hypothetical protein
LTVKLPEPEPVQKFASVTVTGYEPATVTVWVACVASTLIHGAEKLYGGVPRLAVAVNVADPPAQIVFESADTAGFGLTAKLPEPEPVQRFASVTVTG